MGTKFIFMGIKFIFLGTKVIFVGTKFIFVGYPVKEIFGVAKSTVIRTVKNYNSVDGFSTKQRSGRPKALSDRETRTLVQSLRKMPT